MYDFYKQKKKNDNFISIKKKTNTIYFNLHGSHKMNYHTFYFCDN